jgi:hypothetical protein
MLKISANGFNCGFNSKTLDRVNYSFTGLWQITVSKDRLQKAWHCCLPADIPNWILNFLEMQILFLFFNSGYSFGWIQTIAFVCFAQATDFVLLKPYNILFKDNFNIFGYSVSIPGMDRRGHGCKQSLSNLRFCPDSSPGKTE